jgi:hypothetical protein
MGNYHLGKDDLKAYALCILILFGLYVLKTLGRGGGPLKYEGQRMPGALETSPTGQAPSTSLQN